MKFQGFLSARQIISSLSFALALIFFQHICVIESRTIGNSQISRSEPKTPVVQGGFINFEDQLVNVSKVAEDIHFQSDAERDVELQQRPRVSDLDKSVVFPGKTLEKSHTGEAGTDPFARELDESSAEALKEFVEWLSKKGVPKNILSTEKPPLGQVVHGRDTDFSISVGGSLPCGKDGHVLTHDGRCREVVEFRGTQKHSL